MMDLREFLKVLEEEHELQKIKAEVDPKHELGAICKIHNEKPNSPALLFEHVKGHNMSVVGQPTPSCSWVACAAIRSAEVGDATRVYAAASAIRASTKALGMVSVIAISAPSAP